MTFLDLANERYSVRKYAQKPVEEDKLQAVLEAGRIAPTACNYQPQKVYVLRSEEALAKFDKICRFRFQAPMVILVCVDVNVAASSTNTKGLMEDGYSTGEMDASIVATMMMMEAADLGLGTVWVRGFNGPIVAQEFDLQENIRPVCAFPLGYPAEDSKPAPMHTMRKALGETVIEL